MPFCLIADGSMLVMGSHDHKIYLFSVLDDGQVYRRAGSLQVNILSLIFVLSNLRSLNNYIRVPVYWTQSSLMFRMDF